MNKDKIFISHSSKDIVIVQSFVENILRLGLDISSDRIFCTSMEGHGVKSGQYIPDSLRKEIRLSSIALLFISKNYKLSEVCLNEVGAAWVILEKENVIPILLPGVDFDEVGFLDVGRLGLKIYEPAEILKLVQDCKEQFNPSFHIEKLHNKIQVFIEEIKSFIQTKDSEKNSEVPKQVNEWTECFENNLIPFHDIIAQAIPAYNDGIYEIKTLYNKTKY